MYAAQFSIIFVENIGRKYFIRESESKHTSGYIVRF